MEITTIVELIGKVGFMGTILIGALWKLNMELEKRDKLYNDRHHEMKEEIRELREENKQDKTMFTNAISSFNLSVQQAGDMFNIMSSKMGNLEHDVKEIRNDIRDLKK